MQEQINNSSMLKVGTLLRGTYRIDSYLSSGGFGNTYVATNIEFDERVAIKEFFMKGVTQRDENQTTVSVSNAENHNSFLEQKEKFKKEARRLRKLKNEYIVSVHDLFEENGTAYYVMNYVDGENLAERLKRTGQPMSENEIREILPQILDALKSVHGAGIWHLDLKPANIMLTKEGKVKLIDFGASKQMNAQKGGATTSTAISYTNGYAPREQMEQNYDKFGPWTDIYALGATLYNLLTNKRPPLPTDIDDDISEDKHLALPFPGGVSEEMKKLVLQLMHTNRRQRPQDVSELQKVLDKSPSIPKMQDNYSADDEETIVAPTEKKQIGPEKKEIEPEVIVSDVKKKGGFNKKVLLGVIGALLLLLIIISCFYYTSHKSSLVITHEVDSIIEVDDVISKPYTIVEHMQYNTAIGMCQYTGNVDKNRLPDDFEGEAYFNDGRYYKGGFEHGVLTGPNAYFKYPNGDVFKGTFKNNAFDWGEYTIAEDGSSFHGSFKNGQPDKGNWFDKNGKVIQ